MRSEGNNGLIIFARRPVLGKVKTRLAATLGDEKALDIYKRLLIHTRNISENCVGKGFAFLTEKDEENFWNGFSCYPQNGQSLGDRMYDAFSLLFTKGYEHCIIIGSDCPGLTIEIIDDAFDALHVNDMVIGAAKDGGYYLLGMNKLYPTLFKNKNWSTENVYKETLADIETLGLSFKTMPILNDVDEEKDVPKDWL